MSKVLLKAALAASGLAAAVAVGTANADDAQVIELTQTACQFVEIETGDHGYTTTKKADCEAINAKSGAERLENSQTLQLKPGKYVFRVTNKNVPYGLGFYLRGDGIVNRTTLPSVSGGGLNQGVTKDYEITLTAGEYIFSCPLNPTPDYKIVVDG